MKPPVTAHFASPLAISGARQRRNRRRGSHRRDFKPLRPKASRFSTFYIAGPCWKAKMSWPAVRRSLDPGRGRLAHLHRLQCIILDHEQTSEVRPWGSDLPSACGCSCASERHYPAAYKPHTGADKPRHARERKRHSARTVACAHAIDMRRRRRRSTCVQQ
jgi:hypothetical protein